MEPILWPSSPPPMSATKIARIKITINPSVPLWACAPGDRRSGWLDELRSRVLIEQELKRIIRGYLTNMFEIYGDTDIDLECSYDEAKHWSVVWVDHLELREDYVAFAQIPRNDLLYFRSRLADRIEGFLIRAVQQVYDTDEDTVRPQESDEDELHDLREALAALEHEQWAHWTKHMLQAGSFLSTEAGCDWCGCNPCVGTSGEACAAHRWRRQIQTAYADLSEKEKDSDRVWADKVLRLVQASDKQIIGKYSAYCPHCGIKSPQRLTKHKIRCPWQEVTND